MYKPRWIRSLVLLLLAGLPLSGSADDKSQFIQKMVSEHGFDSRKLQQLLDGAQRQQTILDAISKPAEGLPWWKYRQIFVKPDRVTQGVEYWTRHRDTLEKAEQQFGVPPEIIVAIIGVETYYGRHTGKHSVLDALYTLGFHYPPRAAFFRKQLGEYLLLAREETVDPLLPKGSYAGAMGKPQFIPSSFRAYAIDFDNDGKRDIWENDADVIGSVANYFSVHGWKKGQPITARAGGVRAKHAHFVEAGMKPTLTLQKLAAAGIRVTADLPREAATSLVELELEEGQREHWTGLDNFYVITRYNHSNLYAMAVFQLSELIRAEFEKS